MLSGVCNLMLCPFLRVKIIKGAVEGFDAAHPGRVGAVAFWSGSDDETSAPTKICGKMDKQMSYYEWLYGAHIVPAGCRAAPPGAKPKSTQKQLTSWL